MILTTQFLNNLESQLEEQILDNMILINGTINQNNISLNVSYNDFINYLDQNILPVIKITDISNQSPSEIATKGSAISLFYTTISLYYISSMGIVDNNYVICISSCSNTYYFYSTSLTSTDWFLSQTSGGAT